MPLDWRACTRVQPGGLPQDQPRERARDGVSGNRRRRHPQLESTAAECQTRSQQKRWCPHCQREVPNTDLVKGDEFEKGRYVVMEEEDIGTVRVESTRVINLKRFTDDAAIDPIYLDRSYSLAPDGAVAREAFSVIREGM